MNTTFKISKKSKYFEVRYITESNKDDYWSQENAWFTRKEHARRFIKMIRDLEKSIEVVLIETEAKVKTEDVILHYFKTIDSVSTGLDIRSKWSHYELVDLYVGGYTRKYNEALKFCEDTLAHVETEGKFDSYMKDWRRYDKHNDLIKQFKLDVKKLGLDDFEVNELKQIGSLLDEMLEIVKTHDKNEDNGNNIS